MQTEQTLFRYRTPSSLFEDPLPPTSEVERLFEKYIKEMREEGALAKVQEMFSNVLKSISDLKGHVDKRIDDLDERTERRFKGVEARVSVLETGKRGSIAPPAMRALATYKPTDTGSFKLSDFELHDLHAEAATWRSIKTFCRAAAIPVAAALMLALLGWLAIHVWR